VPSTESFRIAELSRRSGVPVPTIKFYVREGLLPAGAVTAPNQAAYDEGHVRRLRLVRTLVEVGGLSLAQVADVLAAVDDDALPLHDALGRAQDAMVARRRAAPDGHERRRAEVDAFVRSMRWRVRPDAAVRDSLADALGVIEQAGWAIPLAAFRERAEAAAAEAAGELATLEGLGRVEAVERSVVGTVGFELLASALRRMALEDASARRFGRRR
jgi:DNA-binding transcriptional MerR regulator